MENKMTIQNNIQPTMSVSLFGGEVRVDAFGREYGQNFSFMGIDGSKDSHATHAPIFAALGSISSKSNYFAPSPIHMNAEVVTPDDFKYSRGHKQWTLPFSENAYLHRGVCADGLSELSPSQGFVMSAADCALVVVRCDEITIAAHAGRDSVIDMLFMKGEAQEMRKSVVDNICEIVSSEGGDLQKLKVWIGFSISAGSHFEHVVNSTAYPHNKKLVEFVSKEYGAECFKDDGQGGALGWLDLKKLIRQQFIQRGVREQDIELDSVCTCCDTREGKPIWYSNRRQQVNRESQNRNLIAVTVNE